MLRERLVQTVVTADRGPDEEIYLEQPLIRKARMEWEEIFAAGASDNETPDEIHASLMHTLGNLTLTAYNAKLANDSFHAKKKLLADSGLAMNREIASARGGDALRSRREAVRWVSGSCRSGRVRTSR